MARRPLNKSISKPVQPGRTINAVLFTLLVQVLIPPGSESRADQMKRSLVEDDWIRQAQAWIEPPRPAQTSEDARGAVDGIRDGKYGFHTGHEPNPWWQVDLGPEPIRICRVLVYNRLDYKPVKNGTEYFIIIKKRK